MAWGSINAIGQHVERKSAVNYFHILNDFALLDLFIAEMGCPNK